MWPGRGSGCLWAGSVDARGRMKNGDHKQEERDAVHSQSSHAVQPFGVQGMVRHSPPAPLFIKRCA